MTRWLPLGLVLVAVCGCDLTTQDVLRNIVLPEQRTLDVRAPAEFPAAPVPPSVPPRTVSHPRPETAEWPLSLDEAIRIALENTQVVRVLTGLSAVNSGQTIYDAAITNTTIDQEQARFDPILKFNNQWSRTNRPSATADPFDPSRSVLFGTPTDAYLGTLGLSKTNVLGGQWAVNWTENPMRFSGSLAGTPIPFALNPQNTSAVDLSYTQPLLQGGGFRVNTAPIVIARLNTERSFFQYKDSVQEMVRGVTEAYWNLVLARVDAWARKIQVQQSQESYQREQARLNAGLADLKDVSQARVTYTQFRANQVAADAAVLTREDALRNILGLPPDDGRQIVPVSAPANQRLPSDWDALVRLAEQRRPDILELKIILEAEQVRLLQAENQALPRLDAVALYRFNGLSGTMPNGERLSTDPGQFTDWTLGVNFSVPLGLRQGRAQARQEKLLIARDRANLTQGIHAAQHELAITVRNLDSAFEQYLAFKEARAAADVNVKVQLEQFRAGRSIYLSVLVALNDWGNAVTSEAQQLLGYNVALATLERQTGTILETHGLVFHEERFRAAGPLVLPGHDRLYPAATPLTGTPQRYPGGAEPAEHSFDLRNPAPRKRPDVGPPLPEQLLPLPRLLPPEPAARLGLPVGQ